MLKIICIICEDIKTNCTIKYINGEYRLHDERGLIKSYKTMEEAVAGQEEWVTITQANRKVEKRQI